MRNLLACWLSLTCISVSSAEEAKRAVKPVTRSQPSSDEAKSARAFIEKMEKDRGYHLGMGDPIRREIANEKLDGKALLRGSIKLLQRGKPEERRKAARC